jgi:signal transduction histidine kinase
MSHTILIVDDWKDTRDALKEHLELQMGAQALRFLEADNGESALEIAREEIPDIMILDLLMPNKPGKEVLRDLQKDGLLDRIYVLVLSRQGDSGTIIDCLRAGAADFINTNQWEEELVPRIRAGLRIIELRRRYEETRTELSDFARLTGHDISGSGRQMAITRHLEKLKTLVQADSDAMNHLNQLEIQFNSIIEYGMDLQRYAAALGETPPFSDVNVSSLIRDVITEVFAGDSSIKLRREVPESVVVKGDRVQLKRLFYNLLENARRAVEGKPGNGEIAVIAQEDADWISIEIADNGIGFSESTLRDPFTFGGETKSIWPGSSKGTGVGLPMCFKIVKSHKGDISIYNRPGGGASVLIKLPRVK